MEDVSNNTLKQRLDALFEKKLFTQIETFKGKKKKGGARKKKKKAKKRENKTKKKASKGESGRPFLSKEFGFTYVTRKSLNSGKGWRNLFNIILFIVPALIMYIADKIVNFDILEITASARKKDKLWIYTSGIEFFQIFVAAYIASSLYHMVFVERHLSILELIPLIGDRFPDSKSYVVNFLSNMAFGLLFIPRGVHYIINKILFKPGTNDDGELYGKKVVENSGISIDVTNAEEKVKWLVETIKTGSNDNVLSETEPADPAVAAVQENNQNIKDFLPYRNQRTTVYLLFYCFAFYICSFFLSKIAKLFLDVFIFKANPLMYFFIILGIMQWFGDLEKIIFKYSDTKAEQFPSPSTFMKLQSVLFWIYLIIHIMVVFVFLTPIAQGIFTIYVLTLFVNFGVFNKIEKNNIQMYTVQSDLEDYLLKSTDTNHFFHKFIFKNNSLMFSFILTIFFLWKCLTTFIPWFMLQNRELRYSFFVLNFLFLLICAKLYESYFKGEEPLEKLKGSFNIGFSNLVTLFSPKIKPSFDNGLANK